MLKQLQIGTIAIKDKLNDEYAENKPLYMIANTELEKAKRELIESAKDIIINDLLNSLK